MIKLDKPAVIDKDVETRLVAIPVDKRPATWNTDNFAVKSFKDCVMSQGLHMQDQCCVWCTLPVGEEGHQTAHRDHIAPKGKYPQWTFHAKNIAIACEYCNGFQVKGELDTVEAGHEHYDSIQFRLVHPYLEDPKRHLAFVEEDNGARVVIRGLTRKGQWTVEHLKLDSTALTTRRAKELIFHRAMGTLPPHFQYLLARATGRAEQSSVAAVPTLDSGYVAELPAEP